MNTVTVTEIKRRGMGTMDALLKEGPVHVVKNNRLNYVVLSEDSYQEMLHDIADARLQASEADLINGKVRTGSVKDLMADLT